MASQYTGDRTAIQVPSSKPDDGVSPIGVLPADGDDLNASSVIQVMKAVLDFVDYCTHRFETFPGVRDYEATRTYTAGMMCLDTDGMTYRVKAGQSSVGIHPAANSTKWERWGYSATELAAAFPLTGNATWGHITLPGGFRVYWAALSGAALPTEVNYSLSYSFANPFPNNCFGAWFQPTGFSATVDSAPSVLVGIVSKSELSLVRPANANAAGSYVSSGMLVAIGN